MHIEVQVALNFVISYLYNKLPRRRVNIFGEELEKALKDKFKGHWYPEKPSKGTAFRCIKTGDPIDPVFERAAKESGVPIQDILENLPSELAVWIDPYEVSYRIGENSQVKILYKEINDPQEESSADREVTKTFNPEAQCFRPIDVVSSSLSGLSLSPKSTSPFPSSSSSSLNSSSNASNDSAAGGNCNNIQQQQQQQAAVSNGHAGSGSSSAPSPTPLAANSYKGSPSPVPAFIPRSTAPLTFTTATFAQTKFGSTKLKTSSKRANRMSPTEFSNYIKQRAMQQQIHHHHHQQPQPQQHQQAVQAQQGAQTPGGLPVCQSSPNSRSLSPGLAQVVNGQQQQQHADPSAYFFHQPPPTAYFPPAAAHRNIFADSAAANNGYLTAADLYNKFPSSYIDPVGHQFYGAGGAAGNGSSSAGSPVGHSLAANGAALGPIGSAAPGAVAAAVNGPSANSTSSQQPDKAAAVGDALNNYGLGYPASNYQHLLVAN